MKGLTSSLSRKKFVGLTSLSPHPVTVNMNLLRSIKTDDSLKDISGLLNQDIERISPFCNDFLMDEINQTVRVSEG